MSKTLRSVFLFVVTFVSCVLIITVLDGCKKPDNQQINDPLPIVTATVPTVLPPAATVVDNSDFIIVFSKDWKVILDDDRFKVLASNDQKKMLAYVRITHLNASIENELFIVDLLRQARSNGTVDNYLPLPGNPSWFVIDSHNENIHNIQWSNLRLDKVTQFSCGGVEETFDRAMCENTFNSLQLK